MDILEECDGQNLEGQTCVSLGYYGGENLSCNDDCTFNLSSCEAAGRCGDDLVQPDREECDGTDLALQTCSTLGYYGGQLACGENCVFVTQLTNDGTEVGYGIVVGASGTYIVGQCAGTFQGTDCGNEEDGFVSRLDIQGQVQGAYFFATGGSDSAMGAALDSEGNLIVVGYTAGALEGGTNQGGKDLFVAKLTANLTLTWLYQYGSLGDDQASSVKAAADDTIFLAGSTTGAMGGGTNQGGEDILVAHFDGQGQPLWYRTYGTYEDESATDLALTAAGDVLIAGYSGGESRQQHLRRHQRCLRLQVRRHGQQALDPTLRGRLLRAGLGN